MESVPELTANRIKNIKARAEAKLVHQQRVEELVKGLEGVTLSVIFPPKVLGKFIAFMEYQIKIGVTKFDDIMNMLQTHKNFKNFLKDNNLTELPKEHIDQLRKAFYGKLDEAVDALRIKEYSEISKHLENKWSKFISSNNEKFYNRLIEFRKSSNLDTNPILAGQEGKLWLSEINEGKALKRWFGVQIGKFESSVSQLREMETIIKNNKTISKDLDVVKVYEKGDDWILREFDKSSKPLKEVLSKSEDARKSFERLKVALKNVDNELLKDIYKKLNKQKAPSANLHWSASKNKILIIDIDGKVL